MSFSTDGSRRVGCARYAGRASNRRCVGDIGAFGQPQLAQLLGSQQMLMHEMVLGEVAMGSKRQRENALELLPFLPMAQVASHLEAMALVDRHQLYGSGVSYGGVHLLTAAVLQPGTRLWTHDKRLQAAAEQLGVAFTNTLH